MLPTEHKVLANHISRGTSASFSHFEKILALSKAENWWTRGLYAAAKYTLDLEALAQSYISSVIVEAFQKLGSDDPDHSLFRSWLVWLAHLDLIKYAITITRTGM